MELMNMTNDSESKVEYPTLEEFQKDCCDEYTNWETRWDFYLDHTDWLQNVEIITKHTIESLSEDENDWVSGISVEELWEKMLVTTMRMFRKEVCDSIPDEVVEKYMSDTELLQWNRMKSLKVKQND